jgi:hypothetical protein
MLQELKDFEERTHQNRSQSGNDALMEDAMNENWEERRQQEQRQREKEIVNSEPAVIVIRAGEPYYSFRYCLELL